MTTLAYTVPTPGTDLNAIADPEMATALTAIKAWANGNVDGSNVAATLTGRRLVANAYMLVSGGVAGANYIPDSSGAPVASGATPIRAINWAYLDPTNFAVTGKSNTQLVLRMSLGTSTAASGVNFTAQLFSVSMSGGSANVVVPTQTGAVAGSTVAINTPSASSVNVVETSAFTFPAAGAYALGVATSGTTAANSGTTIALQLFALNS